MENHPDAVKEADAEISAALLKHREEAERAQARPSTSTPPRREQQASVSSTAGPVRERTSARASARDVPLRGTPGLPPADWDPRLTEIWARFPGQMGPVMGWHRTGASFHPDTHFSADGDMRWIARSALVEYLYSTDDDAPPQDHPFAVFPHPALQSSIRDVLTNYQAIPLPGGDPPVPVTTQAQWRTLLSHNGVIALPYRLECTECHLPRRVTRQDSRVVESLPQGQPFHCHQIGATCRIPDLRIRAFVVNPLPISANPESGRSPGLWPPLNESQVTASDEDQKWRKRLKQCTSVPKYKGSNSLVRLRAWKEAMQEAFRDCKTPVGRTQVLGAAMFLADAAEDWWSARAGISAGVDLRSFDDLCTALEKHFIPPDTMGKAVLKWNSLRQKGTVEEYMREVDELALIHPLGEVGEFWQAWNGLRPELKAEVRYVLKKEKKEVLTRSELRDLLEDVEVKYIPMQQPRAFFPFASSRRADARAAIAAPTPIPGTTPSYICWVCDRKGHRAPECTRRKTTGCARCGSRAHKINLCPQRKSQVRPAQTASSSGLGPRNSPGPTL